MKDSSTHTHTQQGSEKNAAVDKKYVWRGTIKSTTHSEDTYGVLVVPTLSSLSLSLLIAHPLRPYVFIIPRILQVEQWTRCRLLRTLLPQQHREDTPSGEASVTPGEKLVIQSNRTCLFHFLFIYLRFIHTYFFLNK